MKRIIGNTISSILIFGLPILFAANGYGLDTWEYWAVLGGVFFANVFGMLRMVDDE
jgi:hypothetical protein